MRRIKHIFDYFDEDGKPIGGCEPVRDTTDKPTNINHGYYRTPCIVMYVGWCYEDESIYSGCYFPDSVDYNKETKQLTPIYDDTKEETIFGKIHKNSKHSPREMTYEMCCKIKGVPLCESYIKRKEEKERVFNEEYQKVICDKEYFRKKYYNVRIL